MCGKFDHRTGAGNSRDACKLWIQVFVESVGRHRMHLEVGVAIHCLNRAVELVQRRCVDQMDGESEAHADANCERSQEHASGMRPYFAPANPAQRNCCHAGISPERVRVWTRLATDAAMRECVTSSTETPERPTS